MNEKALTKFKEEILSVIKVDSTEFSEKNSVSFSGSPMPHPYDKNKFILITDPLSDYAEFFEFNKNDITKIEEINSIATESGESVRFLKIWVKEGSLGLRCEPFIVAKTKKFLNL